MSDFTSLIERRDLDGRQPGVGWLHLYRRQHPAGENRAHHQIDGCVGWWPKGAPYVSAIEVPSYTTSIDAALTLLPEGLDWLVRTGERSNGYRPYGHVFNGDKYGLGEAEASTEGSRELDGCIYIAVNIPPDRRRIVMTNPEWQILDLFGRWVDAPSKEAALGCIKDGTATAIALRRLASSDGWAEVVGWQFQCADGVWRDCFPPTDYDLKQNKGKFRQLYTAPPADAGMRDRILRGIQSAEGCKEHCNDFTTVQGYCRCENLTDEVKFALTAPGATTKSDGGKPDAERTQRRLAVSDDGLGPMQVIPREPPSGPSDPSSTRSEVTVDELADFIDDLDVLSIAVHSDDDEAATFARALLDQFEIRRK